jgi:DNA-binding NarL/FixJ family response regulator
MMVINSREHFSSEDINVLLLAENRLLRETLTRLLQKRAGISVVGVSPGAEITSEEIAAFQSAIVLTDCVAPHGESALLRELFKHFPQFKVILFGMDEDPEMFLKFVHLGIGGYMLKDASAAEIIAAVRAVARGEAACPPKLCMSLIQHLAQQFRENVALVDSKGRPKCLLTLRQLELLKLVAKGLTNKEIAAHLNLSEFTVKNHLRRIMKQVDAEDRHEAVERMRANGLLAQA